MTHRTHLGGTRSSVLGAYVETCLIPTEEWYMACAEVSLLPAKLGTTGAILQGCREIEQVRMWLVCILCGFRPIVNVKLLTVREEFDYLHKSKTATALL